MTERKRRSGRGGLRRGGAQRATGREPLPWREIRNPYPPVEPLSGDQLLAIDAASKTILRDTGIKVLSADARARFKAAGAAVEEETQLVRLDPDMLEAHLADVPPSFRLEARNPSRSVTVGEDAVVFTTVSGPPFVHDLDRGRRSGCYEELCDFLKVVSRLDIIHVGGSNPFEPMDLPADSRHLDKYLAAATLHDKTWIGSMVSGYRARDALEMLARVHGLAFEDLPSKVVGIGGININSPRQLDANMSDAMTVFARAGQAVIVTPFTLLGAMAPITIAGALAQQNAEALAGIVFTQIVRPGAPVVYGAFISNVDMKSGAPAFGTPEYIKATLCAGQLARHYGIPFRASGTNASNAVDAQAAYESDMSLWASLMGHANIMLHAGGWLEGGLTASFEKLIIDVECLQTMAEAMTPVVVNDETLALDTIAEVDPGGHFFASPQTLAGYQDAFYAPLVSDWRNFESWTEAGAPETAERANRTWKALLADYEKPPIDPALEQALGDFVRRRKADIAAGRENKLVPEFA